MAFYEGNDTRKAYISASSQYNTSYTPAEAFNGIGAGSGGSTDAWISTAANGPNTDGSCYLDLDFTQVENLDSIQMCRRDDAGSENFPRLIKIYSSSTGAFSGEETEVYSEELNDASFGAWSDEKEFSSSFSARYMRIEIHTMYTSGGTYSWVAIKEIRFGLQSAYVSGTVSEAGTHVARTVYLYKKSDGARIGTATSNSSTGAYSFAVDDDTTEYFVVALDDDQGTDYDPMISEIVTGVFE